jgi:hypothetical protein
MNTIRHINATITQTLRLLDARFIKILLNNFAKKTVKPWHFAYHGF